MNVKRYRIPAIPRRAAQDSVSMLRGPVHSAEHAALARPTSTAHMLHRYACAHPCKCACSFWDARGTQGTGSKQMRKETGRDLGEVRKEGEKRGRKEA